MKAIRKVISLVVVAVMVLSMNGFAEIISYDEAYMMNAGEFTEAKENVLRQIDIYNKNIDEKINKETRKLKTKKNIGGEKELFDTIYPIGSYIVASLKPALGEWVEVTAEGYERALWLSATMGWGTNITESWPKPQLKELDYDKEGMVSGGHKHTFTGTKESMTGQHKSHGQVANIASGTTTIINLAGKMFTWSSANRTSTQAGDHDHKYTAQGTITPHAEHTHNIICADDFYKYDIKDGPAAEPDRIYLKVWERIG